MTTLELEGITESEAILDEFGIDNEELRKILNFLGKKCVLKTRVEETLCQNPNGELYGIKQTHCKSCWGYKPASTCKGKGYLKPME